MVLAISTRSSKSMPKFFAASIYALWCACSPVLTKCRASSVLFSCVDGATMLPVSFGTDAATGCEAGADVGIAAQLGTEGTIFNVDDRLVRVATAASIAALLGTKGRCLLQC